ncbi:MAG: hypothetical protein IKF83_02470 [Clostridia bacterium]|nr:hypothetical protein [Clostridia bacterium]
MKKFISVIVLAIFLANLNLPIVSFAVEETEQSTEKNEQQQEAVQEEQKQQEENNIIEVESETNEQNEMQAKQEKEEQDEQVKEEINKSEETKGTENKENQEEQQEPERNLDSEDEIVELDEKVKNAISTYYDIDDNDDGEYSKKELANPNLTSINIDCNQDTVDLSGIQYMTYLTGIDMYNINGSIDYTYLVETENLRRISLNGNVKNISKIAEISNLETLSINLYNYEDDCIEELYSDISKMTNINELDLLNCDCNNLKALENLDNIKRLWLDQKYGTTLDIETLSKMKALEYLTIQYNGENIAWLENLSNLKDLRLLGYNDRVEFTEDFFEDIKKLSIESVHTDSRSILNFGKIEIGQTKELKFEDFPILKEMCDENSIFHESDWNLIVSENQEEGTNTDCIHIDNENRKISITPTEESRKEIYIDKNKFAWGLGNHFIITWEEPEDNEIVEISSESIKNALENKYIDKNGDGKYTKGELADINLQSIAIFINEDQIDLSPLEYMKNLNYVDINLNYYNNSKIDLSVLKKLNKLEWLSVFNLKDVTSLSVLTNIKKLSIETTSENFEEKLKIISRLSNLEYLYIYDINTDVDIDELTSLNNLKQLSLDSSGSNIKINLDNIEKLNNLTELSLRNFNYENFNSIEKLSKLKSLTLSTRFDEKLDIDTISKLNNLEQLSIEEFVDDVNWLSDLTNLKSLTLYIKNNQKGLDEKFFNVIDSLNLENLNIQGDYSINLGELEPGVMTEFDFADIPLLKKAMDQESTFYTENLRLDVNEYQDNRVDKNCIQIDNENHKIYITAPEDPKAKKQITISQNTGQFYNIKFTWSNPGDDEIIEIDDKIAEAIKQNNSNTDENGDGKFSKGELANIENLYINCNSNKIDLSALEYMINLEYLSIYSMSEGTDLSPLIKLKELKNLTIYGNFKDFNQITELTNLETLNIYVYNGLNTLDGLNKLNHLNNLTLQGFDCKDLSGIENIPNLKQLSIRIGNANDIVDVNSISKIENLETLTVENFNPNNIEWIRNIDGLNELTLTHYSYSESNEMELDSQFFDTLKTFNIQKIKLNGSYIVNLGELENGVERTFNFADIPILNACTDKNSKIYNVEYEKFYINKDGKNQLTINDNKSFTLTPTDSNEKTKEIYNYSVNVKLKWSNPGDNDIVPLSEPIKRSIGTYYDKNGDGEFTKLELESQNLTNLRISFRDNEECDITGIEHLKNLTYLSINSNKNTDFSELKKLDKLEEISISGDFNDISTLKDVTQLKIVNLSQYNDNIINLSILKNLTNLESLRVNSNVTNITELKDLAKLKKLEISYNYDSNKVKLSEITQLINIENLRLSNIDEKDLTGLEKMTNVSTLYITLKNEIIDKLDTNTLVKMNSIKELSINAMNDISWIENIPTLEKLTLSGYYNFEITQDLINTINNSQIDIILTGSFYTNLGSIYLGNTLEYELNNVLLLKELTDKNSKLYDERFNIEYSKTEGRISDIEVTPTEGKIKIKAREFGTDSKRFSTYYSSENKFTGQIYIKWQNIMPGDTTKEIEFKDENLRQALLENYDCDDDKRITEQDMINIESLNLYNKGIKDISGLEKAINVRYDINLSNNKIKDATIAAQMLNLNDEVYIYLDNNEIENVTHIKDANFDRINLNGNYIDFSENSENKKIVVDKLTVLYSKVYDEFTEELQDYFGSKEEYINERISEYFEYSAGNQKTKPYLKGDVNGNGAVDLTDYSMILKHVKGIKLLGGEQKERADVNGNGTIELTDYSMVLKHVKGIKLLF